MIQSSCDPFIGCGYEVGEPAVWGGMKVRGRSLPRIELSCFLLKRSLQGLDIRNSSEPVGPEIGGLRKH